MGPITGNHMSDHLGEPLSVPELPDVHGPSERSKLRQRLVRPWRGTAVEASLGHGLVSNGVCMVIFHSITRRRKASLDICLSGVALDFGKYAESGERAARQRSKCSQ